VRTYQFPTHNFSLCLQESGNPINEEQTQIELGKLVIEVCKRVDQKMVQHLSLSIIVVALMHVVVDNRLFMIRNEMNPVAPYIVCRGKLWKHEDNIPLPGPVLEF